MCKLVNTINKYKLKMKQTAVSSILKRVKGILIYELLDIVNPV